MPEAAGRPPLVAIAEQPSVMGNDGPSAIPGDGEDPAQLVLVDAFAIEAVAVTNARFAAFVAATGHVTDAERWGSSFVFAGLVAPGTPPAPAVAGTSWWRDVAGATWEHPFGPGSTLDGLDDHPVVHVSARDAEAFCAWARRRLPTEAEWELAARGGLTGADFPWGDELEPGGEHAMNVWQGDFPTHNTAADGYAATAPVDAYGPNGFDLYNMTGNVWEWTADPYGPDRPGQRALRGGSYLCHASYCRRYRVSARMANTPETSTGNIGFRCCAATSYPDAEPQQVGLRGALT